MHHEAEYETVHHEEKSHLDTRTTPAWDEKVLVKEAWDEEVLVRDAWDETMPAWEEQVLIKEAWDEEIVTGRKCSICGQTETYDGTEERQRP